MKDKLYQLPIGKWYLLAHIMNASILRTADNAFICNTEDRVTTRENSDVDIGATRKLKI